MIGSFVTVGCGYNRSPILENGYIGQVAKFAHVSHVFLFFNFFFYCVFLKLVDESSSLLHLPLLLIDPVFLQKDCLNV